MPDAVTASPSWQFAATGTRWRLHHSGTVPESVAREVAAAVAGDERRWSRFDPDSELSALNRGAGRWQPASAATIELLGHCTRWMASTGGVFTPLVGQAMAAWGYGDSFQTGRLGVCRSPPADPILGALRVDAASGRVWFAPGTTLDLGGIGKGWMLGRAAQVLATLSDDPQLLIDAGGDLCAVRGDHVVAIESVADGEAGAAAWVTLRARQAIATSGAGRRRWVNGDGREAHHLLDPHTGAPGETVHATVVADEPAAADVLAKVLALRPGRLGSCRHPALVQGPDGVLTNAAWSGVARRG